MLPCPQRLMRLTESVDSRWLPVNMCTDLYAMVMVLIQGVTLCLITDMTPLGATG